MTKDELKDIVTAAESARARLQDVEHALNAYFGFNGEDHFTTLHFFEHESDSGIAFTAWVPIGFCLTAVQVQYLRDLGVNRVEVSWDSYKEKL